MKKLILITILTPIISFSQTYYDGALNFQNNIRSFYDLNELKYDSLLSVSAQEWANHLVKGNDGILEFSDNDKGELIYYYKKRENVRIEDYFLDASIGWVVEYDEEETFKQVVCEKCEFVGFGISENETYIYVVANYDKLYE
ncbi:CAP domain-containing protein [Flavobacteriaceae bacterium]|jgi:hypothetical protein|nr:CAP domain-containing protein [Flavobacteriaceae bacterium]|tara:strand:+ start:217 stop:642 length:426 start_codon:yes stop_codon:yes gene_type:complete